MSEVFEFTPERLAAFEQLVGRYPGKRAALLPALHLVQQQEGCITLAAEAYVAQLLELPVVDVHEVVTFYALYFQRPMGRHHIRVCLSLSCSVRGCEEIRRHLRESLKVEEGGVTQDGRFSWEAVPDCLGACELAPMMQLDGEFYGNLTGEKVSLILAQAE